MAKAITFRGYSLQSGAYRVTDAGELFNSPQRDIISHELARSDNAVAVYRKYKSRSFTLSGYVKGDTSNALESAIDALKLNLLSQSGEISAEWAGGYRYWNAECQNVNIARAANELTICRWSAGFFMENGFSTDGSTQNLITAASITAGSQSLATTNIGTYLALPYITLTMTDINPNLTPVSITVGNPSSNEYLTITQTWADGDVLAIDTFKKQIFKNSTLISADGNWPAWAPGSGLIDYSDSGSSRIMGITATYSPRFL